MADLALVWDLIARDSASPTFARVGASAEGASLGVGKLLGGFTALAAGGAIAASVKAAADFQASMLLVQTQAGATSQEVADMSPKILALAGQVAQAPEALATSLYHVESTGLRGAQALDAVKVAAEGAKVGHADLEQTTNALTATIASGMLPATETYAQAMGQLNTIVGSGDMKMQDLNDALSTGLLVTVKQYGVGINDVGAALADFGDNNIRGADAATRLRMAVQAIAAPSKNAAGDLAKIGMTVQELQSDQQTGGLNKAITDLHQHLVDSGIAADQWGTLLTDAFTKKAGAGVLTLIGTFDRFKSKYEEVSKGANTFGDAWAATTQSASFQAARLGDAMQATGITIGTALLPYVTSLSQHVADLVNSQGFQDFLSTVGRDAVVAGNAIGGLVSGFMALPGPVKELAGAFAALKIAEMVGLWGAVTGAANTLAGGVARVGGAMVSAAGAGGRLSEEMTVQQALFAAEMRDADLAAAGVSRLDGAFMSSAAAAEAAAGGLTNVQRMMLGYDTALAETIAEQDLEVATMGRLTTAMTAMSIAGQRTLGALGTAATAGLGAMQKAASGMVNFLGGPWGVALIAGAGVALGFKSSLDQVNNAADALTQSLKDGGPLPQALTELQKNQSRSIADAHSLGDAWGIVKAAFADGASQITGAGDAASAAAAKGKKAYDDWYNSLGLVDQKSQDVKLATANLDAVMRTHATDSLAVRDAANQVQQALGEQKRVQDLLNQTTKTALQLSQEQAQADLGMVGSALSAKQAYDEFNDSLNQYTKDVASGQVSSASLAREQDALNQSTINVAQSAGAASEAWAKANGVTDTSTASQYGQLLALQKVATAMGKDTPAAVTNLIGSLSASVAQGHLTQQQMDGVASAVDGIPGQKKINVTADTKQAQDELNGLITSYQHVQYTGSSIVVNGRTIANAAGNLLSPSPMSSGTAQVIKPGDLRVIGDNPTHPEAYIPINGSARSLSILGETAARMGLGLHAMASGGFLASTDQFTAQPSGSWIDSVRAAGGAVTQAAAAAVAASSGGAARWAPLVDEVLSMLGISRSAEAGVLSMINSESGGNPNAINLWDSNAKAGHPSQGLMQTIPGTFARWRNPSLPNNILDPLANIYAGVNYALHTYGVGMLTGGGRHGAGGRYVGYEYGTNYVPETGLAVLHKGEVVKPATQQGAPYRAPGPMQITGRLEIGGDGMATLVGEVLDMATDRMAYNG